MAPNMVTLTGTLGNAAMVVALTFLDTSFEKELPMWFYCLMSLSIFLYQTMDAVDGKQARRTKTSGPLGQLFDHGCDAAACTLATSLYMQSCLVGRDTIPYSFFFYYVTSHLSFYLSQWEEQHTGILRSNFKGLGITEGKSHSQSTLFITLCSFLSPMVSDYHDCGQRKHRLLPCQDYNWILGAPT